MEATTTTMFNYNKELNSLGIDYAQFTDLLNTHSVRLDEPSDAYIDKELSLLNKAAVIVVNTVDANPNGVFDENWFFSRDLEDALEKNEAVYSAELDKGTMELKIVLNFGNEDTKITFTYAQGGAMPVDKATELVDGLLKEKPEIIYELSGLPKLAPTASEEEIKKYNTEARSIAIEHYRKHILGKPLHVFYAGRKYNVANGAVDPNINILLTDITNQIYANLLPAMKQDENFARNYSYQKAILVLDAIAGHAQQKTAGHPYSLTQDELTDIIVSTINTKLNLV